MGGIVLINPDGVEESVGPGRVKDALAAGYTTRSGDTAALRNPSGSTTTVAVEDVGSVVGPGTTTVDTGTRLGDLQGRWDDSEYGGIGGGAAALGLGVARGATFGLSDLLVDDETAAGYQRENPGLDLVGNIGGSVLGGGVTGLTKGAASLGASLAPGSKAAASLIAGGAEGMAFGAGQAASALIIKNEPLTAESVFTEFGTDIFLGGAFGAAGGLAGHGLEQVGKKLMGRSAAKLADNLDPEHALAANAAEATAVPLNSAKGKVLTEDFVSGLEGATGIADDLAVKARSAAQVELPSETLGRHARLTRDWLEPAWADLTSRANAGSLNPELEAFVKKNVPGMRRMVRDLTEIPKKFSELDALNRPELLRRGGNAAVKAMDPDEFRALAVKLHNARESARTLHQKIGGSWMNESIDEAVAVDRFVKKTSSAQLSPEVEGFAKGYEAAKEGLFSKLMVRDGVAKKRQLEVFAEMGADDATQVAKSYSAMVQNAEGMAKAMGSDFAVQAAQLTDELAKVKGALSSITGKVDPNAPNMSAMQTMVAFGLVNEALPDIDGPADEILGLWLAAKVGKMGSTGVAAKAGKSGIGSWLSSTSKRVGYRVGAQGGGVVAGGIKGAAMSTMTGRLVDGIMGNTAGLARTTGRAVARAEGVVGKLVQGAGKVSRRAAPFAPGAYLKSLKFADLDHDKGMSAFEQRAAEIRANVANSYGVQKTVLENLGDLAMTHPGVADKTIFQADRVMKFLGSKLPRDPGTVQRLGRSGWKASAQDEAKFARYTRAALDPDGELERFADMDLTTEGAEVLRTLYPAKFAKFQEYIAVNLPALQDKLSYPEQVQMSILFNVPVTSLMRPEFVKASQATFAADATADPVSQQPAGSGAASPLTSAQQLLTR